MEELSGRPDLDTLLARYAEMGGIAEHIVLVRGTSNPQNMDTHRQAALRTLEVLGQRVDQEYERLIQRKAYKDLPRYQYGSVGVEAELLSGHQIPLPEFLGPIYRQLYDSCYISKEGIKYAFEAHYADLLPQIAPLPTATTWDGPSGYAYAFSDSAHGLHTTEVEIAAFFFSFAHTLFYGFRCPITIFQWSTNCSNYFDAGHEWWGSFFWTVAPEDANYIVGIAASTTD